MTKKLSLFVLLSFSCCITLFPYSTKNLIFDKISQASGSLIPKWTIMPYFAPIHSATDVILADGAVDPEVETLFQEIAKDLGIDHQNIKIKNSGLLLRIIHGYNNALNIPCLNRVYINNAEFKKMSYEQKKFLLAHELTHSKKNHYYKSLICACFLYFFQSKTKNLLPKKDNLISKYCGKGFAIFSLWALLKAQIDQAHEREADREAILTIGVSPADGITCLDNFLYHPNSSDWPLFFRYMATINRYFFFLYSLPIIKQHTPHLVSFNDRVALLQDLEPAWQIKHGDKTMVLR